MFKIQKTGEGDYLATLLSPKDSLGKTECNQLKHEVLQIIKPHRVISVSLKGVKTLQKEGLRILESLVQQSEGKKCTIRFIQTDPQMARQLAALSAKRAHPEQEALV